MNTPTRIRAGLAAALVVCGCLSGCAEYSPFDDGAAATGTPDARDGTPEPTPTVPEPTVPEPTVPAPTVSEPIATPTSDPVDENEGDDSNGEIPVVYVWSLPPSDTSPSDNDGPAYGSLRYGSCDEADPLLDPPPPYGAKPFGLSNPRVVLLLAAGAAMCRGDVSAARPLVASALEQWGTAGLDRSWFPRRENPIDENDRVTDRPPGYGETECDLYRALTSVLEQVDAEQVACPGGPVPAWRTKDYLTDAEYPTTAFDNPLTPEDESQIPPAVS